MQSNTLKEFIEMYEEQNLHKVANRGIGVKKYGIFFMYDIEGFSLIEDGIEYRLNEMSEFQLTLLLTVLDDFNKILQYEEIVK